jgi:hypothetical protein
LRLRRSNTSRAWEDVAVVAVDARAVRRVLIVLLLSLVVMIGYWVLWFTARGVVASDNRPAYIEFENAFPAADAWLTGCLIGAACTLLARRPSALFWLLAGGGAGMYLFGMDVLYDLEHGIWWSSGAGGVIELVINLLTLAVGVGLLRWAWRRRNGLLKVSPAS